MVVNVRDVTRTHGSGPTTVAALRGVSFAIGQSRLVALRGRAESGWTGRVTRPVTPVSSRDWCAFFRGAAPGRSWCAPADLGKQA
jgi:hypothetical protein